MTNCGKFKKNGYIKLNNSNTALAIINPVIYAFLTIVITDTRILNVWNDIFKKANINWTFDLTYLDFLNADHKIKLCKLNIYNIYVNLYQIQVAGITISYPQINIDYFIYYDIEE